MPRRTTFYGATEILIGEPAGHVVGVAQHTSEPQSWMSDVAAPQDLSERPCLNCGDETPGRFCRNCGQRKAQRRASIGTLLVNALQDQLSLTSELPRTLRLLITRPGLLTREYSDGRIARYIPPLRLYLVASLLFFLLLSFRTRNAERGPGAIPTATADSLAASPSDSVTASPSGSPAVSASDTVVMNPKKGSINIKTPWKGLNDRIDAKGKELQKLPPGESQRRLREFLIQRAPTVVFLLLPLFALMLKMFYWRSGTFYAEHFVFALHTHAFAFLIFSVGVLLPQDGTFKYPAIALLAWLGVYPLLALKRYYAQGWIKTALKYMIMGNIYFVLVLMALIVELIAAVLLI